jgi:RNA polymerase sigma-70 factor (ECF subfamily)
MAQAPHPGHFDTTRWSLVHAAASDNTQVADRALAELCEAYWQPLYKYVRRQGYSNEDAQDLIQSFFLLLIERRDVRRLHPDRGHFRSFLLASVRNFLLNDVVRRHAKKRGGGEVPLSLDFNAADERDINQLADPETPETIYDRDWALTLLDRVFAEERKDWDAVGEGTRFDRLRPCVMGDFPPGGYQALAAELDSTEAAIKMAVYRLKEGFHRRLHDAIADTVLSDALVNEEIQYLLQVLGT